MDQGRNPQSSSSKEPLTTELFNQVMQNKHFPSQNQANTYDHKEPTPQEDHSLPHKGKRYRFHSTRSTEVSLMDCLPLGVQHTKEQG